MNIIFKPFNGKENHPHLVEMPDFECVKMRQGAHCCIGNQCRYNDALSLAKANAVPFREEDVSFIKIEVLYQEHRKTNIDTCIIDPDNIYSVEGNYKIETPNWIHPEDKFAVLLKEETVKSNQNVCWNCKRLLNKNKWHCECGAANEGTEKVESQDELWRELLDKDDTDYNQELIKEALSKFRISRINAE